MPDPANVPIPAALLQGGGEMGALIRSIDWAGTPLGPIAEWPASLRTTVGTVLGSRFPMLLWWGPGLVQLYNDAYRPVLGAKHPRSMGAAGPDVWAEIWHIIGPMAEGILAGGPATWSEHLLLPMSRRGIEREETYFTFSYSPVPGDSGALGGVLVTCQETTAQVLGERRLRTLQKIAADSTGAEGRLDAAARATHALAENPNDLPFSILYLRDGDCLRPVATTGLTSDDAASRFDEWPFDDVLLTRGAVDAPIPDRLRPALCDPSHADAPAVVLPLEHSSENTISGFLVVGTSARLELDGQYRSFLSLVARHVSSVIAQADAYEQERRRAEALAAIDRAKTAFFSNVSHEFRTPLTLMLGPIEESLRDSQEPPSPRQRERLETLHRNSLRLLKLVNALLDFSRIEAGRIRATYQPTDLSTLTADLASSFRSLVESEGLSFTVECEPLPEAVYVDPQMWETIVLNLVSNAFKFTFEGQIQVRLAAADGRAVLEVADTGTGVPDSEVPHLFERFHRVEGARGRTYEGSGIGLALVRELARLHGGSVAVETQAGVGSRFTVAIPFGCAHLPADRISPAAPVEKRSAQAAFLTDASQWIADTASIGPAPTASSPAIPADIVLAEDNADMRAYLRRLLEAEGWSVRAAADAEAALAEIGTSAPDLVLADVMMPRLDGFGLLRALRESDRTRTLPVVLLSARAGEEARLGGLQAGADDYLVKPFTARELVARVRIHLELARTRREAEAQRQSLHDLFMEAPALIAILRGPDHVFELANPLYVRAVGRDVVGKPIAVALPELVGQPYMRLLDEVFRSGTTRFGTESEVWLDQDGDGAPEQCFFDYTYRPMRNPSGAVDGVLVFAYDVTAQVQARQRVEALMTELQLASERKDEFLAMLAHELRNPMAAISLALSLMERSGNDEARVRKHRATARRQMDVLTRLVDDLLDVSRITRGKIELRREPIDLAVVVQNAVAATRGAFESQDHELTVTIAHGAFRMDADATRLEQVVTNLLTNAAKYTPAGGRITVRLARDARAGGSWAELRVQDTGRGIPKEMLAHVFDLFVQVSPSLDRRSGGLGLGLTLVRRLTELHGGMVEARSEGIGKGAEFVVRLPLAARSELDVLPGTADAEDVDDLPRGRRRIVIVEDSGDVRDALRDYLEDLGHEVEVAVDGPGGVSKLLEVRPDVALVDVGLPGIDGYEVARRVRAAAGGEHVYLVALTGYGGPEAGARAARAGFDLHITKPVAITELPRVVSLSRHVH